MNENESVLKMTLEQKMREIFFLVIQNDCLTSVFFENVENTDKGLSVFRKKVQDAKTQKELINIVNEYI